MKGRLIFDTSVWIDFLRNRSTPKVDLLTNYIENDFPVILVPTIVQEILQGIRDDGQYGEVRDNLSYFTILELPPVRAAIGAADFYRALRKKGVTIRKSNDCMIAFYAIEFSIPLVHNDGDFELIKDHSKLRTWTGQ